MNPKHRPGKPKAKKKPKTVRMSLAAAQRAQAAHDQAVADAFNRAVGNVHPSKKPKTVRMSLAASQRAHATHDQAVADAFNRAVGNVWPKQN